MKKMMLMAMMMTIAISANAMTYDAARNEALRFVLSTLQYNRYLASAYFYRPLVWNAGGWSFAIYGRYHHNRMFMHRPAVFVSYRGGHNHRSASFYARHHFNHPAPPAGPRHHGPSAGPGPGHHGPSVGHGNGHHGPSAGYGNGHGPGRPNGHRR